MRWCCWCFPYHPCRFPISLYCYFSSFIFANVLASSFPLPTKTIFFYPLCDWIPSYCWYRINRDSSYERGQTWRGRDKKGFIVISHSFVRHIYQIKWSKSFSDSFLTAWLRLHYVSCCCWQTLLKKRIASKRTNADTLGKWKVRDRQKQHSIRGKKRKLNKGMWCRFIERDISKRSTKCGKLVFKCIHQTTIHNRLIDAWICYFFFAFVWI